MTTSNTRPSPTTAVRAPLRLRLVEHPGRRQVLHGGWWPRSRDLAVELADLVDHFPPDVARVSRVLVSPPDWDVLQRRVQVHGRSVKSGSFPRDDTHLVCLTVADRSELRLLVVPPGAAADVADAALTAAADPDNTASATEILARGRAEAAAPS